MQSVSLRCAIAMALLALVFGIEGTSGFRQEQEYNAMACQMVQRREWPPMFCKELWRTSSK